MAKDGEKLSTTIAREAWDRLSQLMAHKGKDRTKTVELIINEAWERIFGKAPLMILGWSESRKARNDGYLCIVCGEGIAVGQAYRKADGEGDFFAVAHVGCVDREYQ